MKIEVQQLEKHYGRKQALKPFNLTIEPEKIIGLLGRNGAGKTTLLQMMAGHIKPSGGQVLINGEKPFNNRNALQHICLISEANNFKRKLKIREVLRTASRFYPNWSQGTADRLLKTFNLSPSQNAKGLSKGMESALSIIIGLASHTAITIFDEPYIGMDASARYKFYDILLEEYESHPRTFIISTHLIDEVSNLFEEIVLLKDGELLTHEPAEALMAKSLQVSGPAAQVDRFTEGKQILHSAEIMGQKSVLIFGDDLDPARAKTMGLSTERCSIQELMVHLTEKEEKMYV
ncbi:ABC transporter ATP-binding protein [Jeotgalibacillus haloalkalitolerans]|uniref:ABC transporter ATP-binding protein n=1 Tax=Jeotgalibacillus haloalkalitolerans TaxID=3104292 RepID=A0ABU5KI84_9BACL|nr:ABC transporter ATP-binding protein [Jeotgalibacillus sp. HH7-29]MDZ5710952.1 ABC transporter ATP-binding protein [Jeotgalibacillus sp. HH7-29]